MKKTLILLVLTMLTKVTVGQIPSIDPTAIQRLIELRNTVSTLKKGLAIQKSTENNTKGEVANSSAILEAQIKIEDVLRDGDEYLKLAYASTSFSDIGNLVTFSKNIKGSLLGKLKNPKWQLNELKSYLEVSNYSSTSGEEFYDAFTAGTSLDDPMGTTNIMTYYQKVNEMNQRQYALQTALQKKKIQQAFTYYKLADELEKKAQAISEGIKSTNAGKAFSLQNKGAAGLGAISGIGGLFDDLISSEGISPPTISSGVISVGGKNYVMDADGNVYDNEGKFVTNDIGFGVREQALAAWRAENPNLAESALNSILQNPFGVIGSIFGAGPKTPSDFLQEIMKARLQVKSQSQSNVIQTEIYNKILKGATSGSGSDYSSLLSNFSATAISATKSGLRMTTGERISSNKMVIELLESAQELRQKADALLLEATQKTEQQKQVDSVWQRKLIRESLAKMTL